MPFDSARTFERHEADRPDLRRVEASVAQFAANHPYLLFDDAAIGRIRIVAGEDPKLRARFARSLSEPSRPSRQTDLRAMIKQRARRLITTAFVALIAEDCRKAEALAACRRMLTEITSGASWQERQVIRSFLDCAETAVAVAFAYDWLHDQLTTEELLGIEDALLRHILKPALAAYEDKSLSWPRRRDNCCLVSSCGVTIAALSMLRRHPTLAAALLQQSIACAANAFAAFAPDGAWPEGPSYWSLAVRHAGLMVAALESTLGDSFGLADRPGFASTGDFALHSAGPFGAAFDFGDSVRRYDAGALAWLAHRFRRPIDGWLLGDYDGWHLPFALIWSRPPKAGPAELDLPTGKVFRGADLACFRNTWQNGARQRPVYLAIKGGSSRNAGTPAVPRPEDTMLHAQADAGSFIVDGARYRWVLDLGGDNYDLPGYFDHGTDGRSGQRWQYYRVRTAGHNTLVVNGGDQDPRARTKILGCSVEGGCNWIVYDLSAVYGKPAGSIRRGAALIGRQVVIEDEIDPRIGGDIVWAMHTSADPVSVEGATACFRHGRDRLVARILEPPDARFELTMPPTPGTYALGDVRHLHGAAPMARRRALVRELPRRDDAGKRRGRGAPIRRLQIALPAGARRLTVLLLPDCDEADETPLPVAPLDYWLARRPLRLASCEPSAQGKTRRRNRAGGSAVRFANAMSEHSGGTLRAGGRRA